MSKNKIDITENVMSKIRTEKIKMKPKWYFWLGSLVIFMTITGLTIISIFLISLITFSLKSHGPMGAVRYEQILSSFPWWAFVVVFIGITTGIILLRKYDFSYKKNFSFIILVFIIAVLLGGILVDVSGLDTLWMKRGLMKGFYQQYGDSHQQKWNNKNKDNGWRRGNFQ